MKTKDELYEFDERAGIMEFDGGLTRAEAEKLTYILLEDEKDEKIAH